MTETLREEEQERVGEQGGDLVDDLQDRLLECPECRADGRPQQFKNAAGLGRHRSIKHNVPGVTARRRASKNGARPRRRRSTTARSQSRPAMFDRSAAAKLLAPGGMVEVEQMERIHAWLDEGEALYVRKRG